MVTKQFRAGISWRKLFIISSLIHLVVSDQFHPNASTTFKNEEQLFKVVHPKDMKTFEMIAFRVYALLCLIHSDLHERLYLFFDNQYFKK